MDEEYILVKDQLPEKGKDVIVIDDEDKKHYCFTCNCKNPKCKEWRCSLTGYLLMINAVKWKYEENSRIGLITDYSKSN